MLGRRKEKRIENIPFPSLLSASTLPSVYFSQRQGHAVFSQGARAEEAGPPAPACPPAGLSRAAWGPGQVRRPRPQAPFSEGGIMPPLLRLLRKSPPSLSEENASPSGPRTGTQRTLRVNSSQIRFSVDSGPCASCPRGVADNPGDAQPRPPSPEGVPGATPHPQHRNASSA